MFARRSAAIGRCPSWDCRDGWYDVAGGIDTMRQRIESSGRVCIDTQMMLRPYFYHVVFCTFVGHDRARYAETTIARWWCSFFLSLPWYGVCATHSTDTCINGLCGSFVMVYMHALTHMRLNHVTIERHACCVWGRVSLCQTTYRSLIYIYIYIHVLL